MNSNLAKRTIPILIFAALLAGCSGWVIQPVPFPTAFLPSSSTPSIFTATPVVIGVTNASATPAIATSTFTFTPTPVTASTNTPTDTFTPTSAVSAPALRIEILGCNTSIDITHGMGEVTNAFVILKNIGNVELMNLTTTLYANDEGREHPDKTVETASLPVGYQVSLKLTVDSTYKEETPIQVEVNSAQGLFPREGLASCRDIGVLTPNPNGMNTPVPSK